MQLYSDFLKADASGPTAKIGIVGDAMVDEFMDVEIKKISPEFPIIVVQSEDENYQYLPGGAANAAFQFKHFNVDSTLFAFVDDEAKQVFTQSGLKSDCFVEIGNKIPRKRRLYSQGIPINRIDFESSNYGFSEDILQLRAQDIIHKLLKTNLDALILSDYHKGLFAQFDNKVLKNFKRTIIDPKCGDISRWCGCTVFKPNQEEATRLSGKSNIYDAGRYFLDQLCCQAVVITMAANGVVVFKKNCDPVEIKPQKKLPPAESVVGAGDCFAAFYAMSLARGFDFDQAADISFHAGSLYVQNKHNKPLTPQEFRASFDPCGSKFIDNPQKFFAGKNYKLAFTNGCFDFGLTAAHVDCINFAKTCGDKLVVALNSDASVSRLKGEGRPILPFADRVKIISSMQAVDYVVGFDEDTPLNIVEKVVPDVIIKGGDYNKDTVIGGHIAEVIIFDWVESLSTTQKIEKYKSL